MAEILQLFYLKEKKKKNPTTQRTKQIANKQEFRVALLALCALWWLPCTAVAMETQLLAR
jgi:hypothetical protein